MINNLRGALIMFCNRDEIITSLIFFLYIGSQSSFIAGVTNRMLPDIPYREFIPCNTFPVRVTGPLSAELTFAKLVPAMMYYNYCWGKSFRECFQSLKTLFLRSVSMNSPRLQVVQTLQVRRGDGGRRRLWENGIMTITPENISKGRVPDEDGSKHDILHAGHHEDTHLTVTGFCSIPSRGS